MNLQLPYDSVSFMWAGLRTPQIFLTWSWFGSQTTGTGEFQYLSKVPHSFHLRQKCKDYFQKNSPHKTFWLSLQGNLWTLKGPRIWGWSSLTILFQDFITEGWIHPMELCCHLLPCWSHSTAMLVSCWFYLGQCSTGLILMLFIKYNLAPTGRVVQF